jgi:hypothetical protein
MRIVYHGFSDGTYHIFQTEESSGQRRTLEGHPPTRATRIIAFIELNCANTQEGLEKLKVGLTNLTPHLQTIPAMAA